MTVIENIYPTGITPVTIPCLPSPCGPYSICNNNAGLSSCACMPHCVGRPPNCRPECTVNSDCPMHLACTNERCRDPCAGSCGFSALCTVHNHVPMCTCPAGLTGDPFTGCQQKPTSKMMIHKSVATNLILLFNFLIVIDLIFKKLRFTL